MKILATADLHLGKEPTQIPAELRKIHSPAAIWNSIVETAIAEKVDLVTLSGDLIDSKNKFFESIGAFEQGLKKLNRHEITTYAIAGNHDWDVLPRIAASLNSPYFRLLGKGGNWEIATHNNQLQIAGISFNAKSMETSPLSSFPKENVDPSLPILGLLHGHLDTPESKHCPITRGEICSTQVPLWILGHIHKPQKIRIEQGMEAIYAGSPLGLDPGTGEIGFHGPWIIELFGKEWKAKQISTASLRYEELAIDITAAKSVDALQGIVFHQLQQAVQEMREYTPNLSLISLRLHLTGRPELNVAAIGDTLKPLEQEGTFVDGVQVTLNKITFEIAPKIDLIALAEGEHITAQLTRLILGLEKGVVDPEQQALMQEIEEISLKLRDEHPFQGYQMNTLSQEQVQQQIYQTSLQLLETFHQEVR